MSTPGPRPGASRRTVSFRGSIRARGCKSLGLNHVSSVSIIYMKSDIVRTISSESRESVAARPRRVHAYAVRPRPSDRPIDYILALHKIEDRLELRTYPILSAGALPRGDPVCALPRRLWLRPSDGPSSVSRRRDLVRLLREAFTSSAEAHLWPRPSRSPLVTVHE